MGGVGSTVYRAHGTERSRTRAKSADGDGADVSTTAEKKPWPKLMKEQTQAVREVLATSASVMTADDVAKRFIGARADRVAELLETFAVLGAVREVDEGRYVA